MGPSIDHDAIVRLLVQAVPDLIAVYSFGSQASGQARESSDVDLAVLARQPLPSVRRFELEQELAGLLHREVDLVDLRGASEKAFWLLYKGRVRGVETLPRGHGKRVGPATQAQEIRTTGLARFLPFVSYLP